MRKIVHALLQGRDRETGGDDFQAVAFVMENPRHSSQFDCAEHIESIDWIEERTGLDFTPDSDAVEVDELESEPGELFE